MTQTSVEQFLPDSFKEPSSDPKSLICLGLMAVYGIRHGSNLMLLTAGVGFSQQLSQGFLPWYGLTSPSFPPHTPLVSAFKGLAVISQPSPSLSAFEARVAAHIPSESLVHLCQLSAQSSPGGRWHKGDLKQDQLLLMV